MTPYVGVIPPPNVLDKLARNITSSRTALEWPHSVRATRIKLHELCRRKTVQKAIERHAPASQLPTRGVVEVVLQPPPARRPLYRQSSMDFLPVKNEATSVTR
jgi:transcription factor SPN1